MSMFHVHKPAFVCSLVDKSLICYVNLSTFSKFVLSCIILHAFRSLLNTRARALLFRCAEGQRAVRVWWQSTAQEMVDLHACSRSRRFNSSPWQRCCICLDGVKIRGHNTLMIVLYWFFGLSCQSLLYNYYHKLKHSIGIICRHVSHTPMKNGVIYLVNFISCHGI